MCGIIGIVGKDSVVTDLYEGLTVLQHRGQDAAGIATSDGARMHLRKNNGLVRDVFRQDHMEELKGNVGIGHCRYPTAGGDSANESQPMYVNSPYGIALAHNGNLVNTEELRAAIWEEDRRHLNTSSDSEILLNVLAHELQIQNGMRLEPDHLFKAVGAVHARCNGAYAAIVLFPEYGMLAFRDPHGIRPAVLGSRDTAQGKEWIVASESVALDVLGYSLERDIEPGEAVYITASGEFHSRRCGPKVERAPCIFEYVYFARPDSMIDDVAVYKARLRMGEYLARKILKERPDHDIDVVIPIPDTSRTSALPLAYQLGVKYREGFIKNRYIGRTFIMPGQEQRKKSVRRKLNPIDLEFRGKVVLLVDDSIVRGTTSKQIIQMARDAGARKVYFASASPPVRYPNVYGIDMPAAAELVANERSVKQIEAELGADWLVYQDLDDLIAACADGNPKLPRFDTSCFSNEYVTNIGDEYFASLESARSDAAKQERRRIAAV